MRIATANFFDGSIANLQRRQNALQDQQQQLTSGKRIALASDDPTGAARAERALASIGRVEANQRALEASRNSMTLAESAMGDANELLQQARETLVAAGNASYSDAEREGLANKLQGLRDQLLTIANRGDGSGGYIFSGQGSASPPFLDQPGGVSYVGVAGTVQTGNIDNFQLSVDGRGAWEQAASGNGSFETAPRAIVTDPATGAARVQLIDPGATAANGGVPVPLVNGITGAAASGWIDIGRVVDPSLLTGHNYRVDIAGNSPSQTYTLVDQDLGSVVASGAFKPGQAIVADGMALTITGTPVDGDAFAVAGSRNGLKLFDAIDKAIIDLKTTLRTPVQITQANAAALRDVDAVMANLQSVRSQVGERLNNLDGTEGRLAALKQYSSEERSAAEDLDMVQGISEFQNQQTGYDTALKTYAMVQRMSLFQYLT
ncbi:flagellar hook-associated protein FlgL [Pelomonas sp. UHG3]|uniref:Flagellar hook-associated protein FlgL n=1 Tax=Roseateles hydrophilus TaxID=2975054 RepID=A0ACC6C5G5_9BURK|nr:flagellar hook-associated protein FlgL [Pelomonas sp. UHG3]MCY4743668.1 flagellar hook-associated protein FlgL [Pelomonas sp. UHG3]